ncbi:MAG: hypothetical protein ACWGOX_06745 [Desulforhopalus sp.]
MSAQKKLKIRGIMMLIAFFGLLLAIFTPVFPGKVNGLDYMDTLFNKISKGSSYFIPGVIAESDRYAGKAIDVTFSMDSEEQANQTAKLFQAGGASVNIAGKDLAVKGGMTAIMKQSLEDADRMFHNNGSGLAAKYGYNERQVLINWWAAFKALGKELSKLGQFQQAKALASIQTKVLEPAYNYYGVEAGNYKDSFMLIIAALGFYVFYTLWYGFGIMYLFEGLGLKIGH